MVELLLNRPEMIALWMPIVIIGLAMLNLLRGAVASGWKVTQIRRQLSALHGGERLLGRVVEHHPRIWMQNGRRSGIDSRSGKEARARWWNVAEVETELELPDGRRVRHRLTTLNDLEARTPRWSNGLSHWQPRPDPGPLLEEARRRLPPGKQVTLRANGNTTVPEDEGREQMLRRQRLEQLILLGLLGALGCLISWIGYNFAMQLAR